eukprot:c13576_g1_i1.p1 GENE.c13576_g1_i1~~c13576_g1_i1.p1  ORF type:complete len:691 (-),score=182.39 c13576_g1_i1:127-2151(-)
MSGAVIRKAPSQGAVKNKAPAPIQITADQILREAQDRQEVDPKPPTQRITDEEELGMYRMRKRKEFEDNIRRSRTTLTYYIKYAKWEEGQGDLRRARSIFERALEVDYRNSSLWLKYAEMEMRHRNINHARNIWDRAVTLLPRVDQLWYKYSYMEEMLANVAGARQIFERWMEWEPDDNAWTSYVRMEMRYNEIDRARAVFERYVVCHNTSTAWQKYAKFEDRRNDVIRARNVFERALEALEGTEFCQDETVFIAFARFEERVKEYDRARVIFKYALDSIPKAKAQELYKTYSAFEKQHGSRENVEEVVVSKRRFQYEEELKKNPLNYDVWFDYVRLEESTGDVNGVREVYERAIANIPPAAVKNRWRRYIYLWINYALYEELEAKDMERTRAVFQECLRIIPHRAFSFAKIWIMFAHFEIRQQNLDGARKVFGHAMGMAPKQKIFTAYIDLEYQLGNIDRCRKLYEQWLAHDPPNCDAWMQYAQMEQSLEEIERARALYELAINQPLLDMPEVMWKCFIDFEIQNAEYDKVRALYRRLLDRTKHVKVWISCAQFETSIEELDKARGVFQEADKVLKAEGENKEERAMLLQSWKEFESEFGDTATQKIVDDKMPRRIKKRRQVRDENGDEAGWEEYFDFIFPDEEAVTSAAKLLEIAQRWKAKKADQEDSMAGF